MRDDDPYLERLRRHAGRLVLAAQAMRADDDPPMRGDERFDVAMNVFEKGALKGLMRASGADKGLQRTLGRMTGGQFTPAEVETLEDRALDKLRSKEAMKLYGIPEGPPVTVTPGQKTIIDGLFGEIGSDPLGRRARDSYRDAWKAGRVRVQ